MSVSLPSMNHTGIRTSKNNLLIMSSRLLLLRLSVPLHSRPELLLPTGPQGRRALTLGGEVNLPARNSVPVSCIALRSADQSSKSVAKIFSTIIRVSSGTIWFSMTGEYPASSAKRAQYRLVESQDSPRKRLEYPEKGGMGTIFNSSRP